RFSAVKEWWQSRGFDEESQARFMLGASEDGTAATIPFWYRGRIIGLIRRPLKWEEEGGAKYLLPESAEFPDGYKPLFMPGKLDEYTFVVEGILDALAVVVLGFSAVAICGTNISQRQLKELLRL